MDASVLVTLAEKLYTLPAQFVLQKQVGKVIEDRQKMTRGELPMDWGYAENFQYYTDYRDVSGQPAPLNTRLTNKVIGSWGAGLDFVTVYDVVIRTEFTFTNQHHQGFFLSLKKEF